MARDDGDEGVLGFLRSTQADLSYDTRRWAD